jgi:N-acetylgalactosamine kinase
VEDWQTNTNTQRGHEAAARRGQSSARSAADQPRASDWLQLLRHRDPRLVECFVGIYGDDEVTLEMQRRRYRQLLERFGDVFGPQCRVALVRAPGRVNLVGMHVDHRGGHVNPIAAGDVIMAVERRNDDRVVVHNLDEQFEACSFTVGEHMPPQPVADAAAWERWTADQTRERARIGHAGQWSDYVKSPLIYLQTRMMDRPLRGFNGVMSGNVPQAAGLASSSAVVVGAAEACTFLNDLHFAPHEFVEHCAAAEWYVGTRGGAGDHSAIKLSRRGSMAHIGFFPLRVELVPFPTDYRVVICHTGVTAHKAAGARDTFNQRVAAYEIGMLLIRERFPDLAPLLPHLRDLDADHLGVDETFIYDVLLTLPERITRAGLARALPGHVERLHRLYGTHSEPAEGYAVRAVCLFGAAECQRSRLAAERLKTGDVVGFGELMNLSHEGDRLSRMVGGRRTSHAPAADDAYLHQLIADRRSQDATRLRSSTVFRQPGGYATGCLEGDELVDIGQGVEGVVGARLVGAGLGGVVAMLVHQVQERALEDAVAREFYLPRYMAPVVQVCTPLEGAGVVTLA